MITRITVTLQTLEKLALNKLADFECREPRQQAALIIRQELVRRGLLLEQHGLLAATEPPAPIPPPQDAHPEEMQNVK